MKRIDDSERILAAHSVRQHPDTLGFTVLEVVVAMGIFAILFVALMGTIVSAYGNLANGGDRVTALTEAQIVLNNIRDARNQGAVVPGDVVQQFPAGPLNPPRNTLTNQVTTIAYANPAADPLSITVTIQWNSPGGRVLTETLSTAISN